MKGDKYFWKSDWAFPIVATLLLVSAIMYYAIFYVWIPKYNQAMNTIAELKCQMTQYETYENKCEDVRDCTHLFGKELLDNVPEDINLSFIIKIIEYNKTNNKLMQFNITNLTEFDDYFRSCMGYYQQCNNILISKNYTDGGYIDDKIECFACPENYVLGKWDSIPEFYDCRKQDERGWKYPISQNFTLEEMGLK